MLDPLEQRAAWPATLPEATTAAQAGLRALDLVLAVVLSAVLLPLMAVIWGLIKLESGGPAVYSQLRVGHHGRLFRMHKFRTMIRDAHDRLPDLDTRDQPNVQSAGDPRVTRFGKRLRRTSLDELPQLFNVLKGDMSLVGPRPLIPDEVVRFPASWLRRFDVKPGLTGLAQVCGRSDLSVAAAVRLDLRYVRKRNLGLYLWILRRTPRVVFSGSGAY